jgi:hypothetical protein
VDPEFASTHPDRELALYRAFEALAGLASAPDAALDPLVVVAFEVLRAAGDKVESRDLARTLAKRHTSYGRQNPMRYRWGLSHNAEPGSSAYRRPPGPRVHWRPAEDEWLDRDRSGYGRRLMEPIVMAAQFGFWGRVAEDREHEPEVADLAGALLEEALPVAEHDIAFLHTALDPWRDTFALWVLTSEPQTAARLRDLLFTLAIRYGSIAARDGLVRGTRHPWFQRPLVSASAHLASSLWHWGAYPSVVPKLVSFVALTRNPDGSWADENQPPDILTTLAAADLLSRLDPGFDPEPTAAWLIGQQEESGWWRALDPEVPWLTATVARWLRQAQLPFTHRFSWPTAPVWARDRMTGLTTFAAVEELAAVMGELPRLANERIDVAFLDLAGFRAFNSRHGSQDEGDRLLAVLGGALRDMPGVLPVRIGGDEMLILGKPGAGIGDTIAAWRTAWPARLRAAGFTDPVAPRILIGTAPTRDLNHLRRELGEGIFRMKQAFTDVPPEGVQATLD